MAESTDALTDAIEAGDLALVHELIPAQPDRLRGPLPTGENPSFRPMTIATVNCQAEILSFLIAEEGDVMDHSNFPLCRAATRGGCVPTMELLIDHGADVDKVCQDYGPPIIYAVEGGSCDSMELLLQRGAKIAGNVPGSDGQTVSWDALKHAGHFNRDNPWMLPLLIEHGAEVNSAIADQKGGKEHNSALHNVAAKGDIRGVRLLLEHGADAEVENNKGLRPIEVTRSKKVRELLERALADT